MELAGFSKGKESYMAVMLYGIVSTTRAKQIAQTGIVSEGLTTISPVTLKFGSNEVNYFFFNRKDAEEIEQRTKRRAEASNGRKRVRIIRPMCGGSPMGCICWWYTIPARNHW